MSRFVMCHALATNRKIPRIIYVSFNNNWQISGKTLLYTEMVAANALAHERAASMREYQEAMSKGSPPISPSLMEIRGNYRDQYLQRFLNQGRVQPFEGPSVLQLGGSDPTQLYQATQAVMEMVRLSNKRKNEMEFSLLGPSNSPITSPYHMPNEKDGKRAL